MGRLVKVVCPRCNTEGSFSLTQDVFSGPFRCWKCRELFTIRIENGVLTSCETMTVQQQQDFDRQAEAMRTHRGAK